MAFRQWLPLIGLTVSVFIFNMSEFMPVGLLTSIGDDFGTSESQTGLIISFYAWAVAICSLPLMLLLRRVIYRPMLLDGLAQAGDTVVPEIGIHRRLKPLVEDVLPVRYPTRLVATPRGDRDGTADRPAATLSRGRGLVAIGPEGGWSAYELRLFEANGFEEVSFGERILRTDTAVVWAFAALSSRPGADA